jgi:hypothetical protein
MAKAPETIGQEVGRKLSPKDMGFDKETILKMVLEDTAAKHFIARFGGTVTGLKPYKIKEGDRTGETAYGLQGQFVGITADKEMAGTVLYLPGYVNDAIVSIFAADDTISAVKIGYDVYAYYDKDAATSYVFIVHDLLNQSKETVAEIKAELQGLALPSASAPLALPKE